MSAGVSYPDLSVLNLKLADGEVSRALRRIGGGFLLRGSRAGVSQAGVVPFAGIVFQEHDVRIFYRERTDFDLAGKNQGYPFQSNGQRRSLEKRAFIKGWIITDGKVAGFRSATQQPS